MKLKIVLISVLAIMFVPAAALSDSPATSTDFYTAYMDVEMVAIAKDSGKVTLRIAHFLSDPDNPIDVKVAVVNALGWDLNGKSNAELFRKYIADFRGKKSSRLKNEELSADQLLCLGYMTLLDDYFTPDKAIPILRAAAARNKNSFTYAVILSLAESQKAMDDDWCLIWKKFEAVVNDRGLKRDMREEAIEIVFNYISLYRGDCAAEGE